MKTGVAIIGAGLAGLTVAYLLAQNKVAVTILEAGKAAVTGTALRHVPTRVAGSPDLASERT